MKPLRADAALNRQKIMATAEAMFAKDGLGVSVDDIARQAKIGIGTLYRHFPTKDALIAAIARKHIEEFACRAEQLALDPQPTQLREIFERTLADGANKRSFLESLGPTWKTGPEIEPSRARARRAVAKLLTRAQETGEVRDDVSLADVIVLIRGLFTSDLDAKTRARLLRVLFDGLRPPGGTSSAG
jgi:AcrR family transcriptional regulator